MLSLVQKAIENIERGGVEISGTMKETAYPLTFEQVAHTPKWICLRTAPQRRSNERPLLVDEVCLDYPAVWGRGVGLTG